jgi:hypothetical protein
LLNLRNILLNWPIVVRLSLRGRLVLLRAAIILLALRLIRPIVHTLAGRWQLRGARFLRDTDIVAGRIVLANF